MDATQPEGPLGGIRVVEVAHFVAVPAAGALLADLGADVVKVERPGGEIYRFPGLRLAGYDSDFSQNPGFQHDNRGKRSIVLDLSHDAPRAALHAVLERADVLTTNLLPKRRRRYGLDPESLWRRNPRLVVGAITGYGQGGESADEPAFDYSAYWARTGMMDLMRDEGVEPSMLRPGVGDHAAATSLVCGILSALRLRDRDGRGRFVDVSLLQTGLHVLGADVSTALVTREPVKRHDRRTARNPLWNTYRVGDGRWLMLVMVEPDRYWARLCEALERKDLLEDPRFENGFARAANAEALIQELDDTFARRPLDAWRATLDAAGLIWSPVNRVDEAVVDPQARAMGYFRELDHPTAGRFESVAPPFRIEGESLGGSRAAPELGGDGREVLREAGLDEAEIDALLER